MKFSCPNFTMAVILPCLEDRGVRQTYGTADYTPENLPYQPEGWTERKTSRPVYALQDTKAQCHTVGALAKAVSSRLVLS